MAEKGTLYMIPCPISDSTAVYDVVPEANRRVIDSLDYFIVENVRSARRFLSKAGIQRKIDELEFVELNEHTTAGAAVEAMVKPLLQGRSAGVISEAGVPGVADPGALVVEACHRRGIRVVPLVGPSSILMAMMASGLNGQSFAFCGYIPAKTEERRSRLRTLEKVSAQLKQTQIIIETPYRNDSLFSDILSVCNGSTRVCIAADITLPEAFIKTRKVSEWKKEKLVIGKRPCVFLILS